MHDAETEAYLAIKNKKKLDDGMDRRRSNKTPEEKKAKAAKKNLRASNRGALNSTNMHYHDDEKMIQQYYRGKFIERVLAEKGQIAIEDEMLIDILAYAAVRVFRKSRMESMFGRFMDRTAPQDPVAQILSCIKALGLKKNLKGGESGKEVMSKLLGHDAEEMDTPGSNLTIEQWREAQLEKGNMKIERRAMTDFGDDPDYYKVHPKKQEDTDEDEPVFEL